MDKQKIDINLKISRYFYKNFVKGFTLTEIIIVIVLIGIIAAFGIPGFSKIVRKSHERNAILGLTAIHQANSVYEAKKGEYLPGADLTLGSINAGLSIDVKGLDLTHAYTRTASDAYTATSAWRDFTVRVSQAPLSLGGNNPCCANPPGSCPTLADCP